MTRLHDADHGTGIEPAEHLRLAGGDVRAWEATMRRHNRRLYRIARSMLRNDADAEDALQEAYLRAFRGADAFRGDASVATWLHHIVVRECLDRLRRQARRDGIAPMVSTDEDALQEEAVPDDVAPVPSQAPGPDQALHRAQVRALIERSIDALPTGFRTVFVMRALEEMSVEEVAELLRLPAVTVRTRFFRARALLREALARDIDTALEDAFAFDGDRCDRIVRRVLQAL